jgi:hypothetical protein
MRHRLPHDNSAVAPLVDAHAAKSLLPAKSKPRGSMQRLELKVTAATIAVAVGVLFGTIAQAQSLSGIKFGQEISAVSHIAARPLRSGSVGPNQERHWKLSDGNNCSIAADPQTNRIVYTEKKWGGSAHGKPADFPGFVYGGTTLADIRAHAQNNGFTFKEHLIDVRPDSLALFNAYEVEGAPGVVVTFVTRLSRTDDERLRTGKGTVASTGPHGWTPSFSPRRDTLIRFGATRSWGTRRTSPSGGSHPTRPHWCPTKGRATPA